MNEVRYLNLKRESRFTGCVVPYEIYIDDKHVADLENGAEISIPLDFLEHKFYMKFDSVFSAGLIIHADKYDHALYCYHRAGLIKGKLIWEIDKNQEDINKQLMEEEIEKKAISSILNENLELIKNNKLVGERDYSILSKLPDSVRQSEIYKEWLINIKKEYFSSLLRLYIEKKEGYERIFPAICDLYTIPEYKEEFSKYLKHYDYYAKDAINSVLNEDDPITEITKLANSKDNIGEYISDELAESVFSIDDFIEKGDNETAIKNLLLINVDEIDLYNIKKALIISTMTEYPFVVKEWNKDINMSINEINIENIGKLINDAFHDNYDNRFTVRLLTAKTTDNYSDSTKMISIMSDKDEEIKNGYSWIIYFVTIEKISNQQIAFSVYTLYFPALDVEIIDDKSIIEKNRICAQKIILLKEMQNPKINRNIQNINNLIIDVLEKWANNENEKEDIYS